jgi:23S rRNA (cytidine1920-2'-O)/16S rRNA (cytidine1409-2'-O)-methyltransferase
VSSRARAAEAIDEGRVFVGGAPVTTAARQVAPDEPVVVEGPADQYVSRGGHKLEAALDAFAIDVRGREAVDVGSSTGGFTDCLLQRGAAHVTAIDVGRAQLAWSLRTDERVTVLERTNVRDLVAGAVEPVPDLCVTDVSFISLRTVAPHLLAITAADGEFVLLVKPQFEAGRSRLGRGGVVRDPAVHRAVLGEVVDGLVHAGLGVRAVIPSPLKGAEGNIEFLAHAGPGGAAVTADALDAAVQLSQEIA